MDCKKTWTSLSEEKKKQITQVIVVGTALGLGGAYIYLKGMQHGAQCGLAEGVQWLDKTLPETKLVERLTEHLLENPGTIKWKFGNILDLII